MKLVTLEQAKKLKKLGYDKDCLYYYDNEQIEQSFFIDNECKVAVDDLLFDFNNDSWWGYPSDSISAPSISEALDWFREEKGIMCYVDIVFKPTTQKAYYIGKILSPSGLIIWRKTSYSDTHSLAESALLDEVMKYVEKMNEN